MTSAGLLQVASPLPVDAAVPATGSREGWIVDLDLSMDGTGLSWGDESVDAADTVRLLVHEEAEAQDAVGVFPVSHARGFQLRQQ